MKKIFTVIFTLIIISLSHTIVAASTSWTSTENVTLLKTQNQFNIEISVDNPTAYAGLEFGIQCTEGVSVKAVTYSSETSKAGPTVARGLTWFSFFLGNNDLSGKDIATITLEYEGMQNTCIGIDNISIYTKKGTVVDTELLQLKKVITINREGATNAVTPLPEVPIYNLSKSTNNDSGNNINSTTSTNQNNNSSSESTSDIKVYSNNQIANDNSLDSSTNSNDSNNNNIPGKGSKSINKFILVLLIISLGLNAGLGYFVIKILNKKETR